MATLSSQALTMAFGALICGPLTALFGIGVIITYVIKDYDAAFSCLIGTVVCAFATAISVDSYQKYHKKAKSLSYVPPVKDDNLPPDEVLVRGSEELPVEQREILLRPTTSGSETPAEQLLRSSSVEE